MNNTKIDKDTVVVMCIDTDNKTIEQCKFEIEQRVDKVINNAIQKAIDSIDTSIPCYTGLCKRIIEIQKRERDKMLKQFNMQIETIYAQKENQIE